MSAGFSQNQRSSGGHRPPLQQTKTALRQFCNTLKLGGEPSEARRVDSKRERCVCLHARNGIVRYEQFLERSPVTGSGTRARRSPYSRVPLVLADPSVCRGARRFLTARAPEKLEKLIVH